MSCDPTVGWPVGNCLTQKKCPQTEEQEALFSAAILVELIDIHLAVHLVAWLRVLFRLWTLLLRGAVAHRPTYCGIAAHAPIFVARERVDLEVDADFLRDHEAFLGRVLGFRFFVVVLVVSQPSPRPDVGRLGRVVAVRREPDRLVPDVNRSMLERLILFGGHPSSQA